MRRNVFLGIAGVAGFLATVLIITLLAGGMQYLTAPFRGMVGQQETVQSAPYRIAAYDRFYDQCAAVQADEDRLSNLRAQKDSGEAPSTIDTTITAVENSRAQKIRDYNASARAEGTSGQFRASDLPHQIDVEGVTTCEAQ